MLRLLKQKEKLNTFMHNTDADPNSWEPDKLIALLYLVNEKLQQFHQETKTEKVQSHQSRRGFWKKIIIFSENFGTGRYRDWNQEENERAMLEIR